MDVIRSADSTIAAKNKALSLGDLAIKECKKQNGTLNQENTKLLDSASSWYRNPFIVGLIGIAAGVVVGQTVIFRK